MFNDAQGSPTWRAPTWRNDAGTVILATMIDPERITALNRLPVRSGAAFVLYWMQAAQRADCNHALWFAAAEADRLALPLVVVFVLADYPSATAPHYRWMLSGLQKTAAVLRDAGIGFRLRRGEPLKTVLEVAESAALVVVDRTPARWSVTAKAALAVQSGVAVVEVDGESVIPEAVASPKQEWSARTLRLKIEGAVASYASRPLPPVPSPRHPATRIQIPGDGLPGRTGPDEAALFAAYDAAPGPAYPGDRSPEQAFPCSPGEAAGRTRLEAFVQDRLDRYDGDRNDPLKDGSSGLSPYLHFGQVSPLVVISAARAQGGPGYPAFAEQLVVRRELCRNYVRYRPLDYDAWEGLPAWSRTALDSAVSDRRAYLYTRLQFEAATTHDPYWNAAQEQLVRSGTIHNYMRMYWGKMILAWSATPREAFATALYLNDRYALDGRDPNGWAGVAWCFGLHDRPWPARPVYSTVRSMVAAGLRRKFDADAYACAWAPGQNPS